MGVVHEEPTAWLWDAETLFLAPTKPRISSWAMSMSQAKNFLDPVFLPGQSDVCVLLALKSCSEYQLLF